MNKTIVFIAVLLFLNSVASVIFVPQIMALMIPLVIIIAFSPIGKAIASLITGGPVNTYSLFSFSKDSKNEIQLLKEKCNFLERKMKEYDEELDKMREIIVFSDNKKIQIDNTNEEKETKRKIDLSKHKDLNN
ncbi:MAG: hypothetical protein AABZ74_06865 [Cyanobacteriota bacterium]